MAGQTSNFENVALNPEAVPGRISENKR